MGTSLSVSVKMGVCKAMFGLVIFTAFLASVESAMEDKCSDRFYDLCLTPTTDVSTHDTSLEACKLACELEQVLGFCDWFIYTPDEFQSCKMYTNDYHGTLEHALDTPVSDREDQLVQLISQLPLAQLAAHMVVMVAEMATQMMSVTLSTILDAVWTPHQQIFQPKFRTSRAAKKHVRHKTHLLSGMNAMVISPACATTMDNAIAMPML